MTETPLIENSTTSVVFYQDDIPVRGCSFDISHIKAAYREFVQLTHQEADRIVDKFVRPQKQKLAIFDQFKKAAKKNAFRVTVSVIGQDGQIVFGDREELFDSKDLPYPIKTIFFTNTNSHKAAANGTLPPNYFSVWIHFDKPPLFDPHAIVSDATQNFSKVEIRAEDIGYFRAAQNITNKVLMKNRKWYSFIHAKFVYDVGLWFFAIPYALYMITIVTDQYIPLGSLHSSFRVAFFVYASGMSLLIYRALMSYLKWAFPVNVLTENRDKATRHRVMLGAIFFSLVAAGVKSVLGSLIGLFRQLSP